jgi:putative oxidoreductase
MSISDRFASWAPRILGALRIIAGALFACYGAQKLFGAFGGIPPGMASKALLWSAGSIEFVGGVLIMLGLFTRITAFICSGQMAVAYFTGHAPHGFWPIVNHGELAILFCWLFLYIAAQGPGAFALDHLRRRNSV